MSRPLSRRTAILGALAAGCAHRTPWAQSFEKLPKRPPPEQSVQEAQAALAQRWAAAPESFKLVHQVSAHYGPKQYGMTGYLLGRKDGSFRVSAAASFGPRLFDVSKVDGQWEAKIHLAQLAQLDPRHVGRAVERIYFIDAPLNAPPSAQDGFWLQRAELAGQAVADDAEVDAIETTRDGATLAVLRKRFFKKGAESVVVDYRDPELEGGLARRVRLKDARGFELQLRVTQYVPGFEFPPERLHLT